MNSFTEWKIEQDFKHIHLFLRGIEQTRCVHLVGHRGKPFILHIM